MRNKVLGMLIVFLVMVVIFGGGCVEETPEEEPTKQPPTEIPKGILVAEIPETADIIFSSVRYVLNDIACLDENYELKDNFILDADCNARIYNPGGEGLLLPRQLFAMDIDTGDVIQITNTDCLFINGQAVDSGTIMTNAVCSDTNGDGKINESDISNLYLLDLATGGVDCLTCGFGLEAINNPDYSHINGKIVFSAREGDASNPHYIYTIDAAKKLVQITGDVEYMDFDCAWSEDATKIVFNRLPMPALTKPAQVWLMDSDGTNMEKITDGGSNPDNEGPQRGYPIGVDVDPDLSPDNTQIVFSRLKTGQENGEFGVWELIVVDVGTKEEEILDSSYANMVPEWKSRGILFIRQIAATNPKDYQQVLYLYREGSFSGLEGFPYNVFPIGAWGGSWVELE